MDQFKVITVHGEGETIYHVVNAMAPDDEQPAIEASYSTRQYSSGARSCAEYRSEVCNGRGYQPAPVPFKPDRGDWEDDRSDCPGF